jgi:hypothetical protein
VCSNIKNQVSGRTTHPVVNIYTCSHLRNHFTDVYSEERGKGKIKPRGQHLRQKASQRGWVGLGSGAGSSRPKRERERETCFPFPLSFAARRGKLIFIVPPTWLRLLAERERRVAKCSFVQTLNHGLTAGFICH